MKELIEFGTMCIFFQIMKALYSFKNSGAESSCDAKGGPRNCNMQKKFKEGRVNHPPGSCFFCNAHSISSPSCFLIPSTFPAVIIKCLVSDLTFLETRAQGI